MTFEEYLINKKIDLKSFQKSEPQLFENWSSEFSQMHPHSFSAQKLYLLNPIRRRYPLNNREVAALENKGIASKTIAEQEVPSSKPARPVFKPKPKMT